MKPFYKRLVFVVVVAALFSTIGYGVHRYAAFSPNVNFTTLNFKINYEGNFSDYLQPVLIAPGGSIINNSLFSSTYSIHKNPNEPWQVFFFMELVMNNPSDLNSTLFNAIKKYGYGTNDSAVVESIASTTRGFNVSTINGSYQSGTPFVIDPGYSSVIKIVTVNVNTMYYRGPLNLSINVSSPAQNIAFYHTNFSLVALGNLSDPVTMGGNTTDGLPLSNGNFFASSDKMTVTIGLNSLANYSVVRVATSAPFHIPAQKMSEPVRTYNYTNLTNNSYILNYEDSLNIVIRFAGGPYITELNVTVYVQSV